MVNIPGGAGILPSVVVDVETQSQGVAVPIGVLIPAIIGTGSRAEVIISNAQGGGMDGLNPEYTGTNGSDGRHFTLTFAPLVPNRTTIYLNGVPLLGIEGSISSTTTFSTNYQVMIDPSDGHLLLQAAYLVNQGGSYWVANANNTGVGTIQNLTLVDTDAPQETWTIKCISVQRNNLSQPIAGTAIFTAFGSVSGQVLDANGNPITWVANNIVVSNGILSFSILETVNGGDVTISPFVPGDYFTIQVNSGVLGAGASLTATYIAVGDINNPTFFDSMPALTTMCGAVSLDNTLSLGGQLAFANSTPGVLALEAAPPLPRRTSYELETNFNALSTNVNDFIIPFAPGVVPALNDAIHVFVTNPTTGVETQLVPNQYPYYTINTTGNPTSSQFIFSNTNPPGGYSFDYTVIDSVETINFGQDGYLSSNTSTPWYAYFSSVSVGEFNNTYVGQNLVIIDSNNQANIGTFPITAVADGVLQISANNGALFAPFVNEASATFQLIDPLFGLPVAGSSGSDGQVVSLGTPLATFHSTAINFASFGPAGYLESLQLQIIDNTNGNAGLYDITGYNSGTNTLTITKSFISESDLKFEVQNPALTSAYLVLNHNIVPNGYSLRVTIVDERDADFYDAGWENALLTLQNVQCDIVVPLPQQTISVIFQNTVEHCIYMSTPINKRERVAFIGAINGLTPNNLTGQTLAAVESLGVLEGIQGNTVAEILAGDTEDLQNYSVKAAYGDTYRCVYFFPDQIMVQVGADIDTIDGFYIAAAAAGWESGQSNLNTPMTNHSISGFTIPNSRIFNQLTYQQLAAVGVTSLSPIAGGGLVLWGITTTDSGFTVEQEISAVFERDFIAKQLRAAFAGYIGRPGTGDIIADMLGTATSAFKSLINGQIILSYSSLVVAQDTVDPTQYDISATVSLVLPINWVYCLVDVGTTVSVSV